MLSIHTLISQIYFWNKTLHVSESSSVHHQEFFTVHTAVVYIIPYDFMTHTIAVCTVKNLLMIGIGTVRNM